MKKGRVAVCHRPKCLCPNETRGRTPGLVMTYRPSRAGGADPGVKPEVANIGSCQSQAAIVTVWKVSAFERECCGDIASLAALSRQFGGCRRTSASTLSKPA